MLLSVFMICIVVVTGAYRVAVLGCVVTLYVTIGVVGVVGGLNCDVSGNVTVICIVTTGVCGLCRWWC